MAPIFFAEATGSVWDIIFIGDCHHPYGANFKTCCYRIQI